MDNILGKKIDNVIIEPLKYLVSTPISDGPHETPVYVKEGVPFLSVDAIVDGNLIINDARFISEKDAKLYGLKCQPRKGDILIGKAASTGKIAQVKTDEYFSIWSPLAMIRPNEMINVTYLEYFLKSKLGQDQIDNFANVNTQKNVGMQDLGRVGIIVPDIEKQIKIATFLDEKVSMIDKLINEIKIEISELRTYFDTYATEYLKNHSKTNLKRLKDVCEMKKGPFGSELKKSFFVPKDDNTFKVYEQQHAIEKNSELGEYYITKGKYEDLYSFNVKPGDIIISCAGTIGEVYILPNNIEPGIINQALMRVRVNETILKEYFCYVWKYIVLEDILLNSNGSAIKNIPPFSVLKFLKFFLPTIDEQVKMMEHLQEKKIKIEDLISVKMNKINELVTYKESLIYECVTGKKEVI